MISCFNISLMPGSCGYSINTGCRTYGDVVITFWRLWISWNWGAAK